MFAFIDLSSHYFWQWLSLFIDAGFLWYLKLGLLLLLLSRFSRAWLCVTPETAAHQAPPSLGFSRQEPLEWVAISFSNAWKWKVKVKSLSRVRLFTTPWTAAYQAPPAMGFSRQENWSGVPLPSLSHHPTDSTVDSLASSCCTLLPHHHCSSWAPFSPPDLEILAYTLGLVLGPLL